MFIVVLGHVRRHLAVDDLRNLVLARNLVPGHALGQDRALGLARKAERLPGSSKLPVSHSA